MLPGQPMLCLLVVILGNVCGAVTTSDSPNPPQNHHLIMPTRPEVSQADDSTTKARARIQPEDQREKADARSEMAEFRREMKKEIEALKDEMRRQADEHREEMREAEVLVEQMRMEMEAHREQMKMEMEARVEVMRKEMEARREEMKMEMETLIKEEMRTEMETLKEEMRKEMEARVEEMRREMKSHTETEAHLEDKERHVNAVWIEKRGLRTETRVLRKHHLQQQPLGLSLQNQSKAAHSAGKGNDLEDKELRAEASLPAEGSDVHGDHGASSTPSHDLRDILNYNARHPSLKHVYHALEPRSDDNGPLQIVVDHLSQVTSQMTSDLQAMKTQHSRDVSTLQASLAQQSHDLQAAKGATYVHWGSSTCSATSAQLVYSGFLGGSRSSDTGAAANALCVSMTPHLINKSPSAHGHLYGSEYKTEDSHQNTDPVCAVCRTPHPTSLMVPGTDACPAGWTRQYWGYLMAGYARSAAASEYICVDNKLEAGVRSQDSHEGYLLYYIKTICGSLPCPPYQNEKVISCVVCAK